MRKLMVKVSQRKTTEIKQRSRSHSKRKTKRECKSATSGVRQNKIWKPGEVQKKNIAVDDQLQNKVWDLGRQGLKAHDQEIMINFDLRTLM